MEKQLAFQGWKISCYLDVRKPNEAHDFRLWSTATPAMAAIWGVKWSSDEELSLPQSVTLSFKYINVFKNLKSTDHFFSVLFSIGESFENPLRA